MSESESEDEILDRIEAALRKIATAGVPQPVEGGGPDREALTGKLDNIITRLRDGLGTPRALPETAPAVPEELPPVPAPAAEADDGLHDEDAPQDDAPPDIWPEPGA